VFGWPRCSWDGCLSVKDIHYWPLQLLMVQSKYMYIFIAAYMCHSFSDLLVCHVCMSLKHQHIWMLFICRYICAIYIPINVICIPTYKHVILYINHILIRKCKFVTLSNICYLFYYIECSLLSFWMCEIICFTSDFFLFFSLIFFNHILSM
jgi:hypothetical protein